MTTIIAPTEVINTIKPKNDLTFSVVEDIDILGGFVAVANIAERNALSGLKLGKQARVVSEAKTYEVTGLSPTVWTEVAGGGGGGGAVSSVNSQTGAVVLTAANVGADAAGTASSAIATHVAASDPHTEYQKESEKGSAGGYASLGADAKVPAAQLAVPASLIRLLCGDGSDGASGTITGAVTLTRDTNYTTLGPWTAGGSINTNGFVLNVSVSVDARGAPAGAIHNSGTAGGTSSGSASGTAGVGGAIGNAGGGNPGGTGGAGATGAATAGTVAPQTIAASQLFGGEGGRGGDAGASAGVAFPGAIAATPSGYQAFSAIDKRWMKGGLMTGGGQGGSGGGAGGGDGTVAGRGGGGGGGGGGRVALFAARVLTDGTTAAGWIRSRGGAGGHAGTPVSSTGNAGGGGGGAGGGGGDVFVVVGEVSGTAVVDAIDANGGAGGDGSYGSTSITRGGNGAPGGGGGRIYFENLSTGTATRAGPTAGGLPNNPGSGFVGTGGAGGVSKVSI